ncbi:MAG: response regulator [Chloroflexi bacterium]|nr:response regulator [Chloroflexota bacterium]
MVVDDDQSVRDIVARALRSEGYDVITAANGRDALERTSRRSFDLVFLDIRMPGLHGLDVLTLMTAGRPTTPVVILTGQADSDTEERAAQLGAFAYLKKPCSVREIVEVAERLITAN